MMPERRSPCPRCGVVNEERFLKGKDFLHGIPGEFFLSECKQCHLWYQNPLPSPAQISSLYPDDYAPHGSALPNADVSTPAGLRSYIQRQLNYSGTSPAGALLKRSRFFDFWWRYSSEVQLIPRYVPGGTLFD